MVLKHNYLVLVIIYFFAKIQRNYELQKKIFSIDTLNPQAKNFEDCGEISKDLFRKKPLDFSKTGG
jgi:hypothetical protein